LKISTTTAAAPTANTVTFPPRHPRNRPNKRYSHD
jgi:hypothetical protein